MKWLYGWYMWNFMTMLMMIVTIEIEEEQPGYQLLKHLAFLKSWTNYFFGLTYSHCVCMFLKGYNVATVTLYVMLNCPFSFISKLLGNITLFCFSTRRNLHSHAEKAPLTTHHNQVTGYGDVRDFECVHHNCRWSCYLYT